jgi:parallel beta-helix repeat protein
MVILTSGATAEEVPVSTVDALESAISDAQAGDLILVAPGTYDMPNGRNDCVANGTATEPIVLRAENPGQTIIQFGAGLVEGFYVAGSYWVFEDLILEGTCAEDSQCEHAFHVSGDADGLVIRKNIIRNFNAQIKANRSPSDPALFPDDVLVEYNEFYDTAPRNTSNPVTKIDVVGGRRWIVRANYIHDFAKAEGNNISYAAFLKGNSRDGLFERNLVQCESLHAGQIRLGLSFGGGGSGPPSICEEGTCKPEHQNGTMRNNIIANCPADVGIYINASSDTKIFNNTLYDTTGIDMRFTETTGEVRNNLLNGQLRSRDGAIFEESHNISQIDLADLQSWFSDAAELDFSLVNGASFVDQGTTIASVTDDYCTTPRDDGAHDIGALEYTEESPCDTRAIFIPSANDQDAGPSDDPDAGPSDDPDAGPEEPDDAQGCACQSGDSPWAAPGSTLLLCLTICIFGWRRKEGTSAGG